MARDDGAFDLESPSRRVQHAAERVASASACATDMHRIAKHPSLFTLSLAMGRLTSCTLMGIAATRGISDATAACKLQAKAVCSAGTLQASAGPGSTGEWPLPLGHPVRLTDRLPRTISSERRYTLRHPQNSKVVPVEGVGLEQKEAKFTGNQTLPTARELPECAYKHTWA